MTLGLFEFFHRFQIHQITGEWRTLPNPSPYEKLPETVHSYRYEENTQTFVTYWEGLFFREESDDSDAPDSDATIN